MSAQDHLNQHQFYHGTDAKLHEDDEIISGKELGRSHSDKVWFTPHRGDAGYHALEAANTRTPGSPGHVYRVEPMGPIGEDKDDYHYVEGGDHLIVLGEEPVEKWGPEVFGRPLKFDAQKNRWGHE